MREFFKKKLPGTDYPYCLAFFQCLLFIIGADNGIYELMWLSLLSIPVSGILIHILVKYADKEE